MDMMQMMRMRMAVRRMKKMKTGLIMREMMGEKEDDVVENEEI
jgi:hypothetical protein